jgi:hypothetical protein
MILIQISHLIEFYPLLIIINSASLNYLSTLIDSLIISILMITHSLVYLLYSLTQYVLSICYLPSMNTILILFIIAQNLNLNAIIYPSNFFRFFMTFLTLATIIICFAVSILLCLTIFLFIIPFHFFVSIIPLNLLISSFIYLITPRTSYSSMN